MILTEYIFLSINSSRFAHIFMRSQLTLTVPVPCLALFCHQVQRALNLYPRNPGKVAKLMDSPCREGQGHLDLGKVDASGKLEELPQLLTPLQALNVHQHRAGGVCHIRYVPETRSMILTSFLLVGKQFTNIAKKNLHYSNKLSSENNKVCLYLPPLTPPVRFQTSQVSTLPNISSPSSAATFT